MPTFDITSELDLQEVRNAVDQAAREVSQRYDFKNTDSSVELTDSAVILQSSSEDRLSALREVLKEKLVRRKVSLKGLSFQEMEEASKGSVRQTATLVSGISQDKAKELNKFIKDLGYKGVQSQAQGSTLRVLAKKRDVLQEIIATLKDSDFGIPLEFGNFRD